MGIKKYIKESVQWDDLTEVEKTAYKYVNDYIDRGYSIENAVTQGCFDMMNDFYESDFDDYEDPDPRKIKKFLMSRSKTSFGKGSKEPKKVLYVIKDK